LAAKLEDGLSRADQASYRKFRTDKAMQNLVRDRLKDRKS
jgi:hypothetical protein